MRFTPTLAVLTGCLFLTGCTAQNPWWEASQSGWAFYGMDARVPRKAKPVPLSLMGEASTWNQSIYIEGWIESVDQDTGAWMTVSDGTSSPVIVIPQGGFTLPRNARGRRAMAWGHPMVASGSVESEGSPVRTSVEVEFIAQSIMIQGYYGLEAPMRSTFTAPPVTRTPPPALEQDAVDDVDTLQSEDTSDTTTTETADTAPPPIVDLPER
jgi:hypothetical protein